AQGLHGALLGVQPPCARLRPIGSTPLRVYSDLGFRSGAALRDAPRAVPPLWCEGRTGALGDGQTHLVSGVHVVSRPLGEAAVVEGNRASLPHLVGEGVPRRGVRRSMGPAGAKPRFGTR